jgi:hypothetical protein
MINEDVYLAHWEDTRWLAFSSFFFTVPSFYALVNNLYSYSVLLLFTSIISANYWRKATYSFRRNMDLVFAKISFFVFVSNGVYYINTTWYVLSGYSGLIVLLYCYYMSCTLLELKRKNWYKYHMLFHFIMTYEQLIILDSILINRRINNTL